MVTEITLNSRTTDTNDNAYWGIVEDVSIHETNPTFNYGINTVNWVSGVNADATYLLIHMKMPEQPENADIITSISLNFYIVTTSPAVFPNRIMGLYTLDENDEKFVEGSTVAGVDSEGVTWNETMAGISWNGDRRGDAANILSTKRITGDASGTWLTLNIYKEGLNFGSESDYIIHFTTDPVNATEQIPSTIHGTVAQRPYLEVKYIMKEPEIPDAEDEILTIEPNPNDPTQPILKWKKPENNSLRMDVNGAYCVVRHTAIIDGIGDGTLIAQLSTDAQEYIDTSTLTENNLYYYIVYFCSETDYIANSGGLPILMTTVVAADEVFGNPIASNKVWMIRPDVSTFIFDTIVGANYEYNVKDQATATITAATGGDFAATPSPVQHTKYQFDWKGDSTETGWVELDTPANSKAKTHYYLGYQAATSAKARIENSLGFWSDATNSDKPVKILSIIGIPIVNVSPKAMTTSETILRVLGDQSYARSSNETITKYEFRVIRFSDSFEWDSGGADWSNVGSPRWEDMGTTPYMDIPANKMSVATTYICTVRVTTSDFGVTGSNGQIVTVSAEASVDMKAILTSSSFEVQNMGRKRSKTSHMVIEGTSDTVIDSGIKSPAIRLTGHCYGSAFQTDYNQLNTWEDNDTLLKVYTDPQASASAKFVEGWIAGLQITKRDSMNITWECDFRVKNATL